MEYLDLAKPLLGLIFTALRSFRAYRIQKTFPGEKGTQTHTVLPLNSDINQALPEYGTTMSFNFGCRNVKICQNLITCSKYRRKLCDAYNILVYLSAQRCNCTNSVCYH